VRGNMAVEQKTACFRGREVNSAIGAQRFLVAHNFGRLPGAPRKRACARSTSSRKLDRLWSEWRSGRALKSWGDGGCDRAGPGANARRLRLVKQQSGRVAISFFGRSLSGTHPGKKRATSNFRAQTNGLKPAGTPGFLLAMTLPARWSHDRKVAALRRSAARAASRVRTSRQELAPDVAHGTECPNRVRSQIGAGRGRGRMIVVEGGGAGRR